MDERSVVKIKYQDGSEETEMWLDETYGVPLKVVVNSGETYMFKDFQFNTLSDGDVVPAFTEEIPQD